MGKFVWLLIAAAAVGLVGGGSFSQMTSSPKAVLFSSASPFHPGMSDDEIFEKFFSPNVYLLKPEELAEPPLSEGQRDSTELEAHMDNSSDDDDSDEVAERGIQSGAKYVLKQIGKVGLNLLKKGLNYLRSAFYKFGGKRLLKRSKKYLKEEAFTIDPLSCAGATCSSCAIFTLPFKISKFKACAEMGVKREKNKDGHMMTNFTVDFNVVKKSLFSREFEVGDISNCYEFGADPDGRAGLAALVGKVCVQGFEFSVKTDKTMKFCLAVVFKRWATGYRFCAQRLKREPAKEGEAKDTNAGGKGNTGNGTKAEKDKYESKGRVTDHKKRQWKVELKRISAGEQDGQIVSDTPLFKNEGEVRRNQSKKVLSEGRPA